MAVKTQAVRLTALAIATGTLVASGAGTAVAAPTVERDVAGIGSGAVLTLELNLPVALPGTTSKKITQTIVLTQSEVTSGAAVKAVTESLLGRNGNVPVLSDLLKTSRVADLAKPVAEPYDLVSLPANPLGLKADVLSLRSQVANPNVDGVLAQSTSSIANVQLGGADLLGLDALLAPVTSALEAALGALPAGGGASDAGSLPVSTVTGTLGQLLGTLQDSLSAATGGSTDAATSPLVTALEAAIAQLEALIVDVQDEVAGLADITKLVDIGLIQSSQKITRKGGSVTSSVTNELAGVELLGGLVSVEGLKSAATATAGGVAGTAKADGKTTVLKVKVGDLLTAELTDKINAVLGGQLGTALPPALLATVNSALAQATALLGEALGIQYQEMTYTEKESADGSSARAEVTPAFLSINPLKTADPLVKISFVPALAEVSAQSRTIRPITPAVTPSVAVPTALPRTGVELPMVGAVAAGLIGLALVARRRRSVYAD